MHFEDSICFGSWEAMPLPRDFLTGISEIAGDGKGLVLVTGALAAKWLFLWFRYRQRIFLGL